MEITKQLFDEQEQWRQCIFFVISRESDWFHHLQNRLHESRTRETHTKLCCHRKCKIFLLLCLFSIKKFCPNPILFLKSWFNWFTTCTVSVDIRFSYLVKTCNCQTEMALLPCLISIMGKNTLKYLPLYSQIAHFLKSKRNTLIKIAYNQSQCQFCAI